MSFKCKVCDKEFSSERGLHGHLKSHALTVADYYVTFYPRKNLLTKEQLPFRNKEEYFFRDFANRNQLMRWCCNAPKVELKKYITRKLKERIEKKELSLGPSYLDLKYSSLPDIDHYKECFGSYTYACKELGVDPIFSKPLPKNFWEEVIPDMKIFIDTREQKPLKFKNSEGMKLDVGDYTSSGDYYDYTYIDRKSEGDFKSTLTTGYERFRREMTRVKENDSYIIVVTEISTEQLEKNNSTGYCPHKVSLSYMWHNMKKIQHEFAGTCQFVFTGGRKNSEKLIPRLLYFGRDLWDVDLQYFIEKFIQEHELGKGKTKK